MSSSLKKGLALLLNWRFYAFLWFEVHRSARLAARTFMRQGMLPERLRHLRMVRDLRIDDPDRIQVSTTAAISEGVILGVPAGLASDDKAGIIVGDNVFLGPRVELGAVPGAVLEVSDGTTMHSGTVILGNVYLGRNCTLSYNIFIATGTHVTGARPSWLIKDQDEQFLATQPLERVVLEDDVWVGWGVFVNSGVTIGRGAVIGAGSVVLGDVEPYAIYAGVPARKVGARLAFEPPERLLASQDAHLPYFYAGFADDQVSLSQSRPAGFVRCIRTSARLRIKAGGEGHLLVKGVVEQGNRKKELSATIAQQRESVAIESDGAFETRFPFQLVPGGSAVEVLLGVEGVAPGRWGLSEISWEPRGA
jgi:acetyltransferase-like isoleucine patch superfamily enzyme